MSTETRELRCELTEADINERAKEAATLWIEVAKLEGERRGINEAIKPRKERMDVLAYIVESGMEDRMVECYWRYDWENRIKFLHRGDNDAFIEQQPIRDHERQTVIPFAAPTKEPTMFDPCPSGPCVMVKCGSTCAPAFCGKQPPPVSDAAPLFKISAASCEHPISARFQDSNALICEACGTVLDTHLTEPGAVEVETSKQEECDNVCPSYSPENETQADLDLTNERQTSTCSNSQTELSCLTTEAPNKSRACCMPYDRKFTVINGISVMYCTKCLLVHRKIDKKTEKEVAFITGETIPPEFATGQPFRVYDAHALNETTCQICKQIGSTRLILKHLKEAHNLTPEHYRKQLGLNKAEFNRQFQTALEYMEKDGKVAA